MRASPGDCRVAEPVGYENPGHADGVATYDQGDGHVHGHTHSHGYDHVNRHHGYADTDAHDSDTHIDTDPGTVPGGHRYDG